ncbi:hypothetical protein ACFVJ3_45790 [Rhodococcus sp. NPDC127593]|uniref:hypothetical protein n=1 Tax=Rhodococcus sp. NPDC127593 TaxID=3345404 RepID=UPI003635225D
MDDSLISAVELPDSRAFNQREASPRHSIDTPGLATIHPPEISRQREHGRRTGHDGPGAGEDAAGHDRPDPADVLQGRPAFVEDGLDPILQIVDLEAESAQATDYLEGAVNSRSCRTIC